MLKIILLFIFLTLIPAQSDQITTIFLVRHAEKMDKSKDPKLSEIGKQRADQIKYLLQGSEISAIYSSDFIRTKDTARPLADLLKLDINIYDHRQTKPLVEAVMSKHKGKNILVTAHSNTVNRITAAFGGKDFGKLDESQYDFLYVISVIEVNGKLQAKYNVLHTLNKKL